MPRDKAVPVQRLRLRIRHTSGVQRVEAAGSWTIAKLQAVVTQLPGLGHESPEMIYFLLPSGMVVGNDADNQLLSTFGLGDGAMITLRINRPPSASGGPPKKKQKKQKAEGGGGGGGGGGSKSKSKVKSWKSIQDPTAVARAIMTGGADEGLSRGHAAHDQFAAAARVEALDDDADGSSTITFKKKKVGKCIKYNLSITF